MAVLFRCPKCNGEGLDVSAYESMIVVTLTHAVFTLRCPHCAAHVSALAEIPESMREEVQFAAIEVGAGMGLDC